MTLLTSLQGAGDRGGPRGEGKEELKMASKPWKRSKLGVNKFVGDLRSRIVHEWLFKSWKCGIREIPTDSLAFFGPDTLQEAETKGFSPCAACLPFNQKSK
jgi:hypothetical protein